MKYDDMIKNWYIKAVDQPYKYKNRKWLKWVFIVIFLTTIGVWGMIS